MTPNPIAHTTGHQLVELATTGAAAPAVIEYTNSTRAISGAFTGTINSGTPQIAASQIRWRKSADDRRSNSVATRANTSNTVPFNAAERIRAIMTVSPYEL
jgi:hypothetical protein